MITDNRQWIAVIPDVTDALTSTDRSNIKQFDRTTQFDFYDPYDLLTDISSGPIVSDLSCQQFFNFLK